MRGSRPFLVVGNRIIDIDRVSGIPPDSYVLAIHCSGISSLTAAGVPNYEKEHKLLVRLTSGYSYDAPIVRVLMPIYHPNVAGNGFVCIADAPNFGWTPSIQLDSIVLRTTQLLNRVRIDFVLPYNPEAAAWARANTHLFALVDGDASQL